MWWVTGRERETIGGDCERERPCFVGDWERPLVGDWERETMCGG